MTCISKDTVDERLVTEREKEGKGGKAREIDEAHYLSNRTSQKAFLETSSSSSDGSSELTRPWHCLQFRKSHQPPSANHPSDCIPAEALLP
jgi:hypothetical protein